MDLGRGPSRLCRGRAGGEFGGDHGAAAIQGAGQDDKLFDFLDREGEPLPDVAVDVALQGQVDRRVEQGAGWREDDFPVGGEQGLQLGQQALEVGAPDIAAVDDAEREDEPGRRVGQHAVKLVAAADQVDVQTGDRKGEGGFQVVVERPEIGGQHQLHARCGARQQAVGLMQGGAVCAVEIKHQAGLVDLHPGGAGQLQLVQHLGVDVHQVAEPGAWVETIGLGLGELEEGDRSQQHRASIDPLRLGFDEFVDRLGRGQGEGWSGETSGTR